MLYQILSVCQDKGRSGVVVRGWVVYSKTIYRVDKPCEIVLDVMVDKDEEMEQKE